MAGHSSTSDPRDRSDPHARNQRTKVKSAVRSEAFREMLRTAQNLDMFEQVRTGVSTADALQMCLDRAVAIWQFCASQTDHLAMGVAEDGEVVGFFEVKPGPGGALITRPNRWVAYEREARQDIEDLAATMTRLGIAERSIRIAEAQAVLVAATVRDAAMEAGIPPEQVRALGEALRTRLTDPAAKADLRPTPFGPDDTPNRHNSAQVRPHLPSSSRSQDPSTSTQVATQGPGHGQGDHGS